MEFPMPLHLLRAQPIANSWLSSVQALACWIGRTATFLPVVTFVTVTAGPGRGPNFGRSVPFGESPASSGSLVSASCAGAGRGSPFRSWKTFVGPVAVGAQIRVPLLLQPRSWREFGLWRSAARVWKLPCSDPASTT